MGISIDTSIRIAGFRPSVFKTVLDSLARTRDPGTLIDRASLFPHRRDGAILLEECVDRAFVDPEKWYPTEAGKTLIRAKVQKRTPITAAERVLDELLDRIEVLNRDPDALEHVQEVWLFGSVLRRQADVGDIDLAIVSIANQCFANDQERRENEIDRQVGLHRDAPLNWPRPWSKEEWLTDRNIYGRRRHPLLAPHTGLADLVALCVPCRLLYDRDRGGRVQDSVIDHHPSSSGRADTIRPLAAMPDLTPAPLRPMDARWLTAFHPSASVSPYSIFRGWTDDTRRAFPERINFLKAIVDSHCPDSLPWRPRLLKANTNDGRHSVVLIDEAPTAGIAAVLRRRIEIVPGAWTLTAQIGPLETRRKTDATGARAVSGIASVATLLLAVDAERMLRRLPAAGDIPDVRISIDAENASDPNVGQLVDAIRYGLAARTVAIEPPEWSGRPAMVMDGDAAG